MTNFATKTIRITESDICNIVCESVNKILRESSPTKLGTRSGLGKKLQRAYDNGHTFKIRSTRTDDNNERALNTIPTVEDMTVSFKELVAENNIEPIIHLNYYSFHQFRAQYTLTINEILQIDVSGVLMNCTLINKRDEKDVQEKQMLFTNESMIRMVRARKGDDFEIRKGVSKEGQQNQKIVSVLLTLKTDYLNAETRNSM